MEAPEHCWQQPSRGGAWQDDGRYPRPTPARPPLFLEFGLCHRKDDHLLSSPGWEVLCQIILAVGPEETASQHPQA